MNLHPLAIDMMITLREETKQWIQFPDKHTAPGYTIIRRAASPDEDNPGSTNYTEKVRMERVKDEMASDFILLESLSYALRKHGVAE